MGKLSNVTRRVLRDYNPMSGKTLYSLAKAVEKYGHAFTITGVKPTEGKFGEFFIFSFAEDDAACFGASNVMIVSLAQAWIDVCNGDLKETNELLASEPQRLRIEKVPNKAGDKTYWRVTELEELPPTVIPAQKPVDDELATDPETGEIQSFVDEEVPF